MAKSNSQNLKSAVNSLLNLWSSLIRRFPLFFLVFIWLCFDVLMLFTNSKNKMEFILCILISLISIIIYSQTHKYAETILSFMIGVLTIFTINWDGYNSKIFIAFYIGINIIFFFLNTIHLASKIEVELTHAASYINIGNFKHTYNELKIICDKQTKFSQINVLERAEVIKYLAYTKIKVDQMFDAITHIEMIKVVYGLTIKEAFDFYKDIHFVVLRSSGNIDISGFLDTIVARALPLTPDEFIHIFDKTKIQLISGKLNVDSYLNQIEYLLYEGHSSEGIVTALNS